MSDTGIVRAWSADEGWGVIDSLPTPGGCWANFSSLAVDSFWEPQAGESVEFSWEAAVQDGFPFRATRVWPAGQDPAEDEAEESGFAYGSHLTIEFD